MKAVVLTSLLFATAASAASQVKLVYEREEQAFDARPGAPVTLDVRLSRPDFRVTVISKPAGATVEIDGRTIGKAPVSTTVKGFTALKLELSAPGHQSWSDKLYVKKNGQAVTATLKKARKGR